jgi:hypothetical protein
MLGWRVRWRHPVWWRLLLLLLLLWVLRMYCLRWGHVWRWHVLCWVLGRKHAVLHLLLRRRRLHLHGGGVARHGLHACSSQLRLLLQVRLLLAVLRVQRALCLEGPCWLCCCWRVHVVRRRQAGGG